MIADIEANGEVSPGAALRAGRKAFAHTAAYDGAIAGHLGRLADPAAPLADFPATLAPRAAPRPGCCATGRTRTRRRRSTLAPEAQGPSLARAEVLHGKELSYNNILDLDAAMKLCAEFSDPAAVIIKHTNPCGAAIAEARAC